MRQGHSGTPSPAGSAAGRACLEFSACSRCGVRSLHGARWLRSPDCGSPVRSDRMHGGRAQYGLLVCSHEYDSRSSRQYSLTSSFFIPNTTVTKLHAFAFCLALNWLLYPSLPSTPRYSTSFCMHCSKVACGTQSAGTLSSRTCNYVPAGHKDVLRAGRIRRQPSNVCGLAGRVSERTHLTWQ